MSRIFVIDETWRNLKNQSQNISDFQKYFKIEFYWIHIDIVGFKNSILYMLLAL